MVSQYNVPLLFWEWQEHCHFLDVTLGDKVGAARCSDNWIAVLPGCLRNDFQQLVYLGGPSKPCIKVQKVQPCSSEWSFDGTELGGEMKFCKPSDLIQITQFFFPLVRNEWWVFIFTQLPFLHINFSQCNLSKNDKQKISIRAQSVLHQWSSILFHTATTNQWPWRSQKPV